MATSPDVDNERRRDPGEPLRLLVPLPPGGATEFTARTVAAEMSRILGRPLPLDYKVGDAGIAALRELAGADAGTLMIGSVNTNSITPVVHRTRLTFDYAAAVVAVSKLVEFPSVLLTRTSVPTATLPEFIEYARTAWGRIKNGTDWIGSFPDLDALILGRAVSLEIVNVARPGGIAALLGALIDGETDMVFANARNARMAVSQGQVKALAVTGPRRVLGFPSVPTMDELGFAGIGTPHWQGLFASGRTSADAVTLLHRTAVRALNAEDVKAAIEDAGARVTPSASPAEFAAEIQAEMTRWQDVIAGMSPATDPRGTVEGRRTGR